jgi:hypothetical protein
LCYSGTIYSRCTPIAETQQQQQEKCTTKSLTKVCKHPSIHPYNHSKKITLYQRQAITDYIQKVLIKTCSSQGSEFTYPHIWLQSSHWKISFNNSRRRNFF